MKERNIALCIVFTIITCGIYGWFWLYGMAEDVNTISGRTDATSPGMVVLFTIVTCGIYGWFWLYRSGQQFDEAKAARGAAPGHLAILYLLLGIFGLSIVSYALIQSECNDYARGGI